MSRAVKTPLILLSSTFAVLGTCAPAPALTLRTAAAKPPAGLPAPRRLDISLWSFFHS
jgi:hypothetical protein